MPRAWAEIDLAALRENVAELRRIVGPATGVVAIVKANGYGHGAVGIARAALESGARAVGVATASEAVELREAGVSGPVLVLQPVLDDEAEAALGAGAAIVVSTQEELDRAARTAALLGRPAHVHVKVDVGLARNGAPLREAEELIAQACADRSLVLAGIMTHLPRGLEAEVTRAQLAPFGELVARARRVGVEVPVHAAASAAAICEPSSRFDLVRPGLALYGLDDGGAFAAAGARLRPVLSLRARIVRVREIEAGTPVGYGATWTAPRRTTLAVVGMGYDDGYPYKLGNRGTLLVRGERCPIVGTVMMDSIVLDVSHVSGITTGDTATAIGRDGDHRITVEEVARDVGVIPYVVTCGLGRRVERVLRNVSVPAAALETSARTRRIAAA